MKEIIILLNILVVVILSLGGVSCRNEPAKDDIIRCAIKNRIQIDSIVKSGIDICNKETKDVDLSDVNSWLPRGFQKQKSDLDALLGVRVEFVKFYRADGEFIGLLAWYSDDEFIYRSSGSAMGLHVKIAGYPYNRVAEAGGFSIYSKR